MPADSLHYLLSGGPPKDRFAPSSSTACQSSSTLQSPDASSKAAAEQKPPASMSSRGVIFPHDNKASPFHELDLMDVWEGVRRLFLQSDVAYVSVAMRNIFEKYGFDLFDLSPLHRPDNVFHSSAGLHPHHPAQAAPTPTAPTWASIAAADPSHPTLSSPAPAPAPPSTSATTTLYGMDAVNAALGSSGGLPGAVRSVEPQREGTGGDGGSSSSSSSSDSAAATLDSTQGSEEDADGPDDTADEEETERGDAEDDYEKLDSVWGKQGWLNDNPFCAPTEREHYVMQQGLPVYRVLLVRKG
ncbi:MAG: hypothetical protein WDW36_004009 [Sanguina aurantia]